MNDPTLKRLLEQSKSKPRSTEQDVAYLILVVFGLLAAAQLWRVRVKPWLVDHGLLTAQGGVSTHDVIGVVLIVLPVVILFIVLRRWMRRRLRRRLADLEKLQHAEQRRSDRGQSGGKQKRGDR